MNQREKMWKCTVCGYIHYGDEPPAACPVCGATADLFTEEKDTAEYRSPRPDRGKWRCMNCEYVHSGKAPPDECPVCGVPRESFESIEMSSPSAQSKSPYEKIVIIGGGIAGFSAAEAVRKYNDKAELTILASESHLPYYRLNLTRYMAGEIDSRQLEIRPARWYRDNKVLIETNCPVSSIDRENKRVLSRSGDTYPFDKLIIAMGAHPFIPPFPGANRENVMALRTKDDADAILEKSRRSGRAVVIGGGLLGLEAAGALAARGVDVTVLEGFDWLLPRQLNQKAAEILEDFVLSRGIKVLSGASVSELEGDDCVRAVRLEDGTVLNTELVILSTGVRPNSYMGRLAGLEVNRGILVNDFLETSVPGIYAAGDVAEHRGVCYGTWGPSAFQGTIAGMNAISTESRFAGIPRSNLLKVLGYDMFSIGEIRGEDASFKTYEYREGEIYYAFFLRDRCLVGSILMGDSSLSSRVKNIIESKESCSGIDPTLLSGEAIMEWIKEHAGH